MLSLVGTWKLVSFEDALPSGECKHPYGKNPIGLLIYTATGHMSVQIMSRDRQPVSEGSFDEISANEIKDAVAGFTGFCGTYSVDSGNRIVVHRVECHVLPGSVGKELRRAYELDDDRLVLKPSDTRSITWERVREQSRV
jgi:hypothetical protein